MPKHNMTLPGDKTKKQLIDEVLRVNHAGEYGAIRIYQGQLKILAQQKEAIIINHMKNQEQNHLEYFAKEIIARNTRPSVLNPLWHFGGYALGMFSALMGKKYAFATTVAVEEIISQHYQNQLEQIPDEEMSLKEKIAKFRDEELEHKDISLTKDADHAFGYQLFSTAIKKICKLSIFLAKKY